MILKHLYDYSHSRNLLSDPAFSTKAVRWIIDLDAEGNLIGQGPTPTDDEKRGKPFDCPQTTRAKEAGGVSEFLADGISAVFGLESDWKIAEKKSSDKKWQTDRKKNLAAKKTDFWRQMANCARVVPLAAACQRFSEKLQEIPCFFRRDGNAWKIRSASGVEYTLGPDNFSFRVSGDMLLENNEIKDWWRGLYASEVIGKNTAAAKGLCIITGESGKPIAERHPKIMSVPGGQHAGASLVSFDKDAFASYGFSRSLNCPTSDEAANAYCAALNALIQSEDTSLRIGGTVLCFWAKETKVAGGIFASLLNRPDPQSVAKFIKSPWAGIDRELAKKDSFIAITLKGCAGRVAVSHWIQEPLEQAVKNFEDWFADLELSVPLRSAPKAAKNAVEKRPEYNPLSIYRLANCTVREAKDLRPETLTLLYRAALEGTAPSTALIKPILAQLRSKLADKDYKIIFDESRFALLKLILNRNRKDSDMEIRPQLTADTEDPAYNCGRLLSVLSETQKKAQGYPKGFTGVAERYFGTASTSPATVLPLLLRLNRHHLDKIRKAGRNAYEEIVIRDILTYFKAADGLPPVFPRHLDLQAQGRFALGFYQQQAADAAGRAEAKEARDAENAADPATESMFSLV